MRWWIYVILGLSVELSAGLNLEAITSPCDQNFLGDAGPGIISSPNFPFQYYPNKHCDYVIHFKSHAEINTERTICFRFRRFDLQPAVPCNASVASHCLDSTCVDYLSFNGHHYCGPSGYKNDQRPRHQLDSVFSNQFCFPAGDTSFRVTFVSDGQTQGRGFNTEFYVTEKNYKESLVDNIAALTNTADLHTDDNNCNQTEADCQQYCYHGYETDVQQCVTCQCVVKDNAPCPSTHYTCFNLRCIEYSLLCDHKDDCGDDSDESYEHAHCSYYQDNDTNLNTISGCDFELNDCASVSFGWDRLLNKSLFPYYDHTVGTAKDGYMMQASYKGGLHTSLSFTLNTTFPNHPSCLRFWYYMYDDVGTLHLETETEVLNEGSDDVGVLRSLVWARYGDQGPLWHQGLVNLPLDKINITKVIFRTISGVSSVSSIALDDVSIIGDTCYGDDISCTFELGLCGWSKVGDLNTSHWVIRSGPTDLDNKGPIDDANGGGHYLSISNPTSTGSTAMVLSKPISNWSGTNKCLTYYYHMYGDEIGALNVYLKLTDGSLVLVDNHYGNQGPHWHKATISIDVILPFQILFKALIDKITVSYIAIDNVEIRDAHCTNTASVNPIDDPFNLPAVSTTAADNLCGADEFHCDNGRCIPDYFHCDRRIDCLDQSDEKNCQLNGDAGIVALVAIAVCILSILIIAVILYSRHKSSYDLDNRVSNVTELVNAYRHRAELEATNRDQRHQYNDLPPDISEPPPDYLSPGSSSTGHGALGPDLTVALKFPPEPPPNYRKAIRTKAYMPSTIGPNPPPYTNILPDGGFPKLENEAFEEDDDCDKENVLINHPSTSGADEISSISYIPTDQQRSSITSAALSPFRSLLRRGRLARSVRERTAMADALRLQAEERPASYNATTYTNQHYRHDSTSFINPNARLPLGQQYPGSSTFPRSTRMTSLNTIATESVPSRDDLVMEQPASQMNRNDTLSGRSPESTLSGFHQGQVHVEQGEGQSNVMLYDNAAMNCDDEGDSSNANPGRRSTNLGLSHPGTSHLGPSHPGPSDSKRY